MVVIQHTVGFNHDFPFLSRQIFPCIALQEEGFEPRTLSVNGKCICKSLIDIRTRFLSRNVSHWVCRDDVFVRFIHPYRAYAVYYPRRVGERQSLIWKGAYNEFRKPMSL